MPFWSGETLLNQGAALFIPFDPKQIDCNAYVLRMGAQYYRTADEEKGGDGGQQRELLSEKESFVIPAGQFAFLLSKEIISVPANAMAFISMRTAIKFQGLINVSGFHVDPGYSGRLVYAVYNASPSPIHLTEGDQAFKIWFCDMDRTSQRPFVKAPDEGLHEITGDMVRGMNREILSLQSLAEKLRGQDARFAEQKSVLDNLGIVWRTMQIGVIAAIIVGILAVAFPILLRAGDYLANLIPPVAVSSAGTDTSSTGQQEVDQDSGTTQDLGTTQPNPAPAGQ